MSHGVASAFGWWLYICMNVCKSVGGGGGRGGVGGGVWEVCMCNVGE